jgi:4-diphosphocytidyl-2-C-methyl-D-erythritol kinase
MAKDYYNQSSMPTTVRSHAKINLGLGIGAPRADGFHALVTVYQTLEMHDLVTVAARPATSTTIRITTNHPEVPTDERNTAWKMVSLALEGFQVAAEVAIHIDKRLPVQGGLGAGSANAVAALVGLEAELGRASQQASESASQPARRLELASQVGSDVPLFLIGGTVFGLDRGQQVHPLPDLDPIWTVVAFPETGVSTPQAFRDWDALCAREGLTAEASADKLRKLSRAYAAAFSGNPGQAGEPSSSGVISSGNDLAGPEGSIQGSALVRTGITSWIENDFERVVFPQYPSLREIKRILLASGAPEAALYASLSGSGSALFGLYQTRGDAEAAEQRLARDGVRSHLTRTLPRQPYWRAMLLHTDN